MRVLLIDDHPLMRTSLKQMLHHSFGPWTIEDADSASAAMAKLSAGTQWDLIFLDLDLPDRSGLDLLQDIRALSPRSRVLVFSGKSEQEFGKRVLHAGAAGYHAKGSSPNEVIEAVRRVISGRRYVSPELAVVLADSLAADRASTPHEALSAREFEVLRLFGQGCTVSEIGVKLGISIKTASTYRTRILEKLALRTTGDIVRYAVTHQLISLFFLAGL